MILIMLKRLRYSVYVIFHPFDGFWSLKKEHIGNVSSAIILLITLIVTNIIYSQFSGFLLNPTKSQVNVFNEFMTVLVPLVLWCVSNWCITTLVNGEGGFKDIFIMTCYALTPILLSNIPLLLLGNFSTPEELELVHLARMIMMIWSGLLMIIGLMTIHQFSFTKTIITIIIAILGMAIIMFLILLLFSLTQQIYRFVYLVYNEISLRYR